jgi:predicted ATPase/DNA-binding CsgD family transcriptional regulator
LGHLVIPSPDFVGREEELCWLQDRLEDARRGRGNLIFLAGEAGVGKSRLIAEVATRAQQAGARVLEGKCSFFETALPYAPFIEAFRGLLHACTPSQITALLGPHTSEVVKLLPELAKRLRGVVPSPLLGPAEEKSRLFESLYLVLSRVAAELPLILALEDIHWADPASLELLHFLARRLRRDRWLVLATYRPGELPYGEGMSQLRQELVRERRVQELTVKPLNASETGDLINRVLGARGPAPDGLIAWIFRLGEGNPFFTEEILRSIVDGSGDAGVSLDPTSISGVVVPPTVREMIMTRVSRLTPDARRVLSAAAILGRAFELEALQHVSQLTGEVFSQASTALLLTQLVGADHASPRYSFRHSLIREVVMQHLAPDVRRALHRRAGEFLETRTSPVAAPQVLAHHFHAAGDPDKTIQYATAAASEASSVYAHDEAARFFGLVLEALPPGATATRLAAAEGLGDALFKAAAFDRALDAFVAMLECATTAGMRREMARAYRKLGQVEEAQAGRGFDSWEKGLALLAEIDDPAEEAAIRQVTASARFRIGQYGRALVDARAAVAAAVRSGAPMALSQAYLSLALLLEMVGQHNEVTAYTRQALALARQAGDREAELRALNNGGIFAMEDADFGSARDALERGYALAREYGALRLSWVASTSLSLLAFVDGRWDEAEAMAREVTTRILEQSKRYWPILTATTALGTVLVHRGRFLEAESLLQKVCRVPELFYSVVLARNALATLELKRGNVAASKTLLEEAWKIIETTEYGGSGKTETLLLLTEVSLQLDDAAAARSWLEEAVRAANGYRRLVPAILRVRGEVAAHEGNLDAAIDHYEAGLEHPATPPQPYQEALLRYHLGACLLRRSRPGERQAARAHLTHALAILDRLGAKPAADAVRQALHRIGGRAPSGRALTEREREVLSLLTQGLSNAAIAGRLSISQRTAEVHVNHILTKLNLATRAEAASWAVREGSQSEPPSS